MLNLAPTLCTYKLQKLFHFSELCTEYLTSRKAINYILFEPIGLTFQQTAITLHKTPLYHSFYISPTCQSQLTIIRENIIVFLFIYLFTSIGLSPGGSGYFTCKQNMKLFTIRFKSGGLHEKHAVATWNLGNHLSICL